MAAAASSSLIPKLPYQRLKNVDGFDYEEEVERAIAHVRERRARFSRGRGGVPVRRRFRVRIRSLRKFLGRRAKLIRVSWAKAMKRLKESQAHFGDLFAGNYLFLQVSPTPLTKHCAQHQRSMKGIDIGRGLPSSSTRAVA